MFVLCLLCFASFRCCLVVTLRERADPLALVRDVYCDFATFPFGILGQMYRLLSFLLLQFLSKTVSQYLKLGFNSSGTRSQKYRQLSSSSCT